MRRGNKRKFHREIDQRKALHKALATALIEYGKIKTTLAKAKSITQFAEKLVNTSKKRDLTATRSLLHFVGKKAAKKLMAEIGPRFKEKSGGYIRINKLGRRMSDGAEMALVEFTL